MIRQICSRRNVSLLSRLWSGNQSSSKQSEQQLTDRLQERFKEAKHVSVVDISGGCGAMYEIVVETNEFKGLSRVKQHQLITDTLKTEIKDMHGLRIHTSIPDS
ncbi:bolA-like protein 3 [Sitodiplosis mosellana]|uniref:bolA-like protein 3 n=1 Tax=Sitodiplosis mosellana TaxID=263140 RepID=UPI002444D7C1|nr:bolA-like protein 3 [Sitodiplosis mosellana]